MMTALLDLDYPKYHNLTLRNKLCGDYGNFYDRRHHPAGDTG